MKKRLAYTLIVLFLFLVGVSLFETNLLTSHSLQLSREQAALVGLDDQFSNLESLYLRTAFGNIASRAAATGYVAVLTPRYIEYDSSVAEAR